jgi:uncharacterized protein YidB (DUF937 family)
VSNQRRVFEMSALDSLLEEHGGDLKKLVSRFESSGLEDKVKSWVGTGPNESIGVDDVKRALGPKVGEIAGRLGIGEDEAAEQVAQNLPNAVDKATPTGSFDTADDASNRVSAAPGG